MSFQYSIDLSSHLAGEFDPATLKLGYRYSPWQEKDREFSQGLLCGDSVVKVSLTAARAGNLLNVRSKQEIAEDELEEIKRKILFCLGLEDDLSGLAEIGTRDSHLKRAWDALPGYRLKATPAVDEAILSAVISQNCSRDAFFAMLGEFREKFGRKSRIRSDNVVAFPSPREISGAGVAGLKHPWLKYRIRTIQEIAAALTRDFLTRLQSLPPQEGIAELTRIKGIGDYTARVVQLYGMRRYEVAFVDGYVQKLIGKLYLKAYKPKPREVLQFAEESWGDWQGYALDLIIAHAQLGESG